MPVHLPPLETVAATIERGQPGLVVVRYHIQSVLNEEGITDVIRTCAALPGNDVVGVMIVIPDLVEVSMRLLQQDYFRQAAPLTQRIRAMAFVSGTRLFDQLTTLYFDRHPQRFEARHFASEAEALEWLSHAEQGRSVA